MFYRDRVSLIFLSLLCSLSIASDRPNADIIAQQTNGKIVSTVPSTGDSVSYTQTKGGTPQVYEGQDQTSQPRPANNGPTNSSAGGFLGFIYNLGKTSEKEKRMTEVEEALRKAEAAARHADTRIIARSGGGVVPYNPTGAELDAIRAEQAAHAARSAKYKADQEEKKKMAELAQNAYQIATAGKPAAVIATTPVPSGSSGPTNEQIAEAIKRLDAIKTPSTDLPKTGIGDIAGGAGAAGAGGAAAYNAGVWGSIKAGGAYVVGGAKAAGTYVIGVACAHPYIAAGVAAGTVIGGGLLYNHKKAKKARAVREEIVRHVQEVAASHDVKVIQLEGPENLINPPKSAQLAPDQNGDPRLRGILDADVLNHIGQGKPHGFKDQWGHYTEFNPKTHARTIECYKKGQYRGKNGDGNHVITMTNPETGVQEWVHYRDGSGIVNCGANPMHLPISPNTGLPYQPTTFSKPKGKGTGTVLKTAVVGGALASSSTSTGATYTAMDIPGVGFDARTGEVFEIPNAPSSIPSMPTANHLHKRKMQDIHAIENTLEEYEFRLDPNLTKEEKHRQIVAAREFLAKQNDL